MQNLEETENGSFEYLDMTGGMVGEEKYLELKPKKV